MNKEKLLEEFEVPSDEYMSEVIGLIEQLEDDRDISIARDMDFSKEYYDRVIFYLADFIELLTTLRANPEDL